MIPVVTAMSASGVPPVLQTLDIRSALPLQFRPSAPNLNIRSDLRDLLGSLLYIICKILHFSYTIWYNFFTAQGRFQTVSPLRYATVVESAMEAESRVTWLITGSANPSSPAWSALSKKRNAEAIIFHSGSKAKEVANN